MKGTFQFCLLALSLLSWVESARATLGEAEASIEKDRKILAGARRVANRPKFTVHEITVNSNTLDEFVGADGVVFAISGRGRVHFDLGPLLGSYFSEFKTLEANLGQRQRRSPAEIITSKIRVKMGGHRGDLHFLAYIPERLPVGLDLEDLNYE